MVAKLEAVALLLQLSTLVLLSIADAHVNRHPAFCSWHQHKRAPSMPQSKRAAAARHAPRGSSLTVRRMSTSSGSRAFIEESEGIPLVYMAAQDGRPDVVSGLLESGYSPNQAVQGRTPLWIASNNGHEEVVEILLALNKGPDADVVDVDAADPFGSNPLLAAAEEGHYRVVQQLLHAGANVRAADEDGDTALKLATDNGHTEVASLIDHFLSDMSWLTGGRTPDGTTDGGQTDAS